MRRLDLTFSALLLPLDFLCLLAAAATAYALRYSDYFLEVRPLFQDIPFSSFFVTAAGFAIVWLSIFWIAGLYRLRPRRGWNEIGRVFLACTAGAMLVIAIVFFRREFTTSRFLVLAFWGLAILYVSAGRTALRLARYALLRARIGHQSIAVIGEGKTALDLAALYRERPALGFTVVKVFPTWDPSVRRELESFAQSGELDGVLLADPDLTKDRALDLIAFCENNHLSFRYLADLFAGAFTRVEMETAGGWPVIEVKRTPLDGWGRIAKRAFDIVFSFIILLLISPILLLSAVAIWAQDRRPVIFKNPRVGERGETFNTYKLRSMWRKFSIGPQFMQNEQDRLELERRLIAERGIKAGPVYKIADDPRIMPVGRFLRRWSLDELPQFWNVLMGKMSIVGPRPHQPREVEKYQPRERRVLAIKPGITGLAQISGRSDLSFEDEVRLDLWYIENWSLWLDFTIALKTPFAVFARKGVY